MGDIQTWESVRECLTELRDTKRKLERMDEKLSYILQKIEEKEAKKDGEA